MFFPLMKTEGLEGFLDLIYLPPNNWENRSRKQVKIYLIWSQGTHWNTQFLKSLKYGESLRITSRDLDDSLLASGMCLAYPSLIELEKEIQFLPKDPIWSTRIPEWRNSTGFFNEFAQTSYQGEVFPLPARASLLTFHPFIQYENVENRLLVLNVTADPKIKESNIDFYNSASREKIGSATMRTNSLTSIGLDQFRFEPSDLPAFIANEMAGIPFGLAISKDKKMLSLEHTHPPASFVLFGERNKIQSRIKNIWRDNLKEINK